ncbi:MAG TPA: hypothetical protein VMR14_00275 [Streptosporangiaceae bacterium]|jgi:transcriptional regulator with XRE-family HTH domain|nr:hypothetical protein [Streptosporangiaceae bacterium]
MEAVLMAGAQGEWLRKQRQARSWNVAEMSRRLRAAARDADDSLPGNDCLTTMIRRWEKGKTGVSERYRLHYCRAFDLAPDEFGAPPPGAVPASGSPKAPEISGSRPFFSKFAGAGHYQPATVDGADAELRRTSSGGRSPIESEVLMTAHEGSEYAERAEWRDIGEATLEQLRAEVTRLSREYMTGEPLRLFFEMRRVRERLHTALDRKIWPRDQTELYFLLGVLSALMADTAHDLGSSPAAEELARAGWAYASVIDHWPLMGWLRLDLAHFARWKGQYRRCRELAMSGLEYLSEGPNGAQLHLMHAMAAAKLGDEQTARQQIEAAGQARERDYQDELLEIGGEFGFSVATQHYLAGSVGVEIGGEQAGAITELKRAVGLYAAGPPPGEDHSIHCQMAAHVDLARARLGAGQLDGAMVALEPVLLLPPAQRISSLPQRLGPVRSVLATPDYQGSAAARHLDEQLEQFTRDTISARLADLPSPSS